VIAVPGQGTGLIKSRSAGAVLDCTRGKELLHTTSTKGTEVLGRFWHIVCMQRSCEDVRFVTTVLKADRFLITVADDHLPELFVSYSPQGPSGRNAKQACG